MALNTSKCNYLMPLHFNGLIKASALDHPPTELHWLCMWLASSITSPLPSARQHPSYCDCLEVKREYYQNSCVLDCVTQCSQSTAHLYEQFLQVQQIGFVTLGPLRCA